ncbi:MAG: hypothetical protein U0Q11_22400 [Vicinamibacterales bacterium]
MSDTVDVRYSALSPGESDDRQEATSTPGPSPWLEWSATHLPVTPVLLTGVMLGPQGLAILSPRVLAAIDPALPVALMALGALLGLSRASRREESIRVFGAGALLAVLTMLAVASATLAASRWSGARLEPGWLLPVICAVWAASSVTLAGRTEDDPRRDPLLESEVITMVLMATVLMVAVTPSVAAALMSLEGLAIAGGLAGAGWLLARQAISVTERRVFVMATLLLVGGSADLVGISPVLAGVLSGVLWYWLGDPARETLQRETQYIQHPFIVLVLITAGAGTEWSSFTVGVAAASASARTLLRFVVGRHIRRFTGTVVDLPMRMLEPGVFGVAIVLNLARVWDGSVSASRRYRLSSLPPCCRTSCCAWSPGAEGP